MTRAQPPPAIELPLTSSSADPLMTTTTGTSSGSSTMSPTSRSFFDAITSHIAPRGRSRSRGPRRSRSRTPVPSSGRVEKTSANGDRESRPAMVSRESTESRSPTQSDWEKVAIGRHSSQWLFCSQKKLKRQSMPGV
ncbi:hypothetical protein EJ06DRAFT_532317 [Trichodelitschia bisporula]|uniref:Uncharacterized protein n=1 Tax=Trichodelitschia bisporula TaxID=703511 RepID=A0A6G1HPH4_9PEZI|nr:hypothetical protein EJ06DRAFT_532317 [Trichodelitschia bisporula]